MTTIQSVTINLPLIVMLGLGLVIFCSYLIGTGRVVLSTSAGALPYSTRSSPARPRGERLRQPGAGSSSDPVTRRRFLVALGLGAGGALVWANLPRLALLRTAPVAASAQPAALIAAAAPKTVAPRVALSQAVIDARLSRGQPILTFADLNLDWTLVRQQFALSVKDIAGRTDHPSAEFAALAALAEAELPAVTQTWFEGGSLSATAAQYGVTLPLLTLVLNETMQPFLATESDVLLAGVNQETWRKGICPVCGGKPDFAYLDEGSGTRHLVCARCDAHWLYQRIACPFCGNTRQGSLGYYTEDDGAHRLYVCDACRSYLKAVDLRKMRGALVMPLERTRTSAMDKEAEGAGYRPGWQASLPSN